MKKQNHVINSTDGEKALTNATSIPEKKPLSKPGIERNCST